VRIIKVKRVESKLQDSVKENSAIRNKNDARSTLFIYSQPFSAF